MLHDFDKHSIRLQLNILPGQSNSHKSYWLQKKVKKIERKMLVQMVQNNEKLGRVKALCPATLTLTQEANNHTFRTIMSTLQKLRVKIRWCNCWFWYEFP